MNVEGKKLVEDGKSFCDFGKNLDPLFGRFVLANKRIREEKNRNRVLKPQRPRTDSNKRSLSRPKTIT